MGPSELTSLLLILELRSLLSISPVKCYSFYTSEQLLVQTGSTNTTCSNVVFEFYYARREIVALSCEPELNSTGIGPLLEPE